jgi:hypothetical protein
MCVCVCVCVLDVCVCVCVCVCLVQTPSNFKHFLDDMFRQASVKHALLHMRAGGSLEQQASPKLLEFISEDPSMQLLVGDMAAKGACSGCAGFCWPRAPLILVPASAPSCHSDDGVKLRDQRNDRPATAGERSSIAAVLGLCESEMPEPLELRVFGSCDVTSRYGRRARPGTSCVAILSACSE